MAASKETLEEIHEQLAKQLLARVRDGSATAADLSVARQFLKDNQIEGNLATNRPLRELAATLPFQAEGKAANE